MPPFIVPPPEKKIAPPLKLGRLCEALGVYFDHKIQFSYDGWLSTYERSYQMSEVSLGSRHRKPDGGLITLVFDVDGNKTSENSNLGISSTAISLTHSLTKQVYSVVVEQNIDKSIAIFEVLRWENGVAHFSRD